MVSELLKTIRCWVIVILQSLIGFQYVFEADIILLPLLNDAKISRKKIQVFQFSWNTY